MIAPVPVHCFSITFLGLGNDQEKKGQEQKKMAEQEEYFVQDEGTGDAVGDHIACITNNALRDSTRKKEDNNKEKKEKSKNDQDKLDALHKKL